MANNYTKGIKKIKRTHETPVQTTTRHRASKFISSWLRANNPESIADIKAEKHE
jgi:hypothetical protein